MTNETKLICPEFDGCGVGECVHRTPHTERYSCRQTGTFCSSKCVQAPAEHSDMERDEEHGK